MTKAEIDEKIQALIDEFAEQDDATYRLALEMLEEMTAAALVGIDGEE